MPPKKTPEKAPRSRKTAVVTQMPDLTTPGTAPDAPPSESFDSLEQEVRLRAYALWEERGRGLGQEDENWLRAEQEVLEHSRKRSAQKRSA